MLVAAERAEGKIGFVPANYVEEVCCMSAAVASDGLTPGPSSTTVLRRAHQLRQPPST
jgi:hypothetical protein